MVKSERATSTKANTKTQHQGEPGTEESTHTSVILPRALLRRSRIHCATTGASGSELLRQAVERIVGEGVADGKPKASTRRV